MFDYRGVLTAGRSDFLAYPTGDGFDSHPNSEGQKLATQALVPFLNRAFRRTGLAPRVVHALHPHPSMLTQVIVEGAELQPVVKPFREAELRHHSPERNGKHGRYVDAKRLCRK